MPFGGEGVEYGSLGDYAVEDELLTAIGGVSFPPRIAGTAPTLYADFAAQHYWNSGTDYGPNLSNWFTATSASFSRSSTAMYVNSSGVLSTSASGSSFSNIRFDYDPVSLISKGILLEGQSTNSQLQSGDQSNAAQWAAVAVSVTGNAIATPDGTTSGASIVASATSNVHCVQTNNSISVASGTMYTASFFAKAGTYNFVSSRISDGTNTYGIVVNLTTGVVTSTSTTGAPVGFLNSVQKFGNGWWRIAMTAQLGVTGAVGFMSIGPSNSGTPSFSTSQATFLGDGVSNIYSWGAQFEGSISGSPQYSSYIPTTTAAMARSADIFTFPASYVVTAGGSAYARITTPSIIYNDHLVGNTVANNPLFYRPGGFPQQISTYDGSVLNTPNQLTNTNDQVAMSWNVSGNSRAIAANGNTAVTGTITSGYNYTGGALEIGTDQVSGTGSTNFTRFGMWNITGTGAQLTTLTTTP